MKKLVLISILGFIIACQQKVDKESVKKEVLETEKAFAKMAADEGFTAAFEFYAADDAVILRNRDSLIFGKKGIKDYYVEKSKFDAKVSWTADFVDVSDCGNLAYTYGKYVWVVKGEDGSVKEYEGIFNTIWKRQEDGSWKYVWD